jgi:hypothetical protein
MTMCKNCGKGIKWFKDPVNDKWIPLEADYNLEYESPEEVDMDEVLQWKHKCTAVLTCNKGCGTQIWKQGSKDIRDVISLGKLIRKGDGPEEIEGLVKTSAKYTGVN